jgi:hypothetical protein
MSVTHTTATRNTITDTVLALLNAGSPPGHIIMATSGVVTVATLTLSTTAAGSSSGGTGTFSSITSDTNAVGGTIAIAVFKNAAGTEIFRCSVTATGGGGDIEMNSVVVSAGQTVAITSLTYSAPA